MFDINVKNYGVNLYLEIFSFIDLKRTRRIIHQKYTYHFTTTAFYKLFCNTHNGIQEKKHKNTEQKLKHKNANK